jgi:hypothetical protein
MRIEKDIPAPAATVVAMILLTALSPPRANLVAHWKLDDESGTIALDSTRGNNNGTLGNGPVWTTDRMGGGLLFDGTNDRVNAPLTGIPTGNSARTIALWFNADTVAKGDMNTPYAILCSSNLIDWGIEPIGTTVTDGHGDGEFTDTAATEESKFYRARHQPPPPNIVVIFTDDQTFSAIGYDNPAILTPNLDALAAQGLVFNRACVSSPVCVASRASLMTGQFPRQNGVIALNSTAFAPYRTGGAKANLTLGAQMKSLGYFTVAYGKSHLGAFTDYGFDQGQETSQHDDVVAFANAATFLASAQAKKQPFFLWLAPRRPHLPLLPAQQWLELYAGGNLPLPVNFRPSPLPLSINNQGTPCSVNVWGSADLLARAIAWPGLIPTSMCSPTPTRNTFLISGPTRVNS